MIPENTRRELEWAVTAFRSEKERWPCTAFELWTFARTLGKTLEFAGFHTLRFEPVNSVLLSAEYVRMPDAEGWSESGTLTILAAEAADGLRWKAHWMWGPIRRVEPLNFCEMSKAYRRAG